MTASRKFEFKVERHDLRKPFRIAGHIMFRVDVLAVSIRDNSIAGKGEGAGVYYLNDDAMEMMRQAEEVRPLIESGMGRQTLQTAMAAGGARNAIDCALWDLEAKTAGCSIWDLTGVRPRPLETVLTVGIEHNAEEMAENARRLGVRKLKVKLDENSPEKRITKVREACPDAEIIIDANQAWNMELLRDIIPKLAELKIAMIEQPLPRLADEELEGYTSPVPLCADESCVTSADLRKAALRYQLVNIKLDKTGGLTEALRLMEQARMLGLGLMVGNMIGTSLAMAPSYVIGQFCRFVDLDGPMHLVEDCDNGLKYAGNSVSMPESQLWG